MIDANILNSLLDQLQAAAGVWAFNLNPIALHLFGLLGLFLGTAGFGLVGYLSLGWLLGKWIGTRPLFLVGAILMIAGIQLVSFGLVAEMIAYSSATKGDPPVRAILK